MFAVKLSIPTHVRIWRQVKFNVNCVTTLAENHFRRSPDEYRSR